MFPNSFFGSIGTGVGIGNSNYNGAVAIARYQGRHGIYFEGSYTLGKSIDNGSSYFGSTGERAGLSDSTNLAAERGPSAFDIRHRAVFTLVDDLPVGPGHRLLGWNNGVNRQVFGGWQVSSIVSIQSGTPSRCLTTPPTSVASTSSTTAPTSLEPGRFTTTIAIRTRPSTKPTSLRLHLPGEWEPQGAINTTAQGCRIGILPWPRSSRWARKESVCDSARTSLICLTTLISPILSRTRAAGTSAKSQQLWAVLWPRRSALLLAS